MTKYVLFAEVENRYWDQALHNRCRFGGFRGQLRILSTS